MKTIILCLLLAVTSAAQVKKPEPSPVKVPFAESLQAAVVTTENWTAINGRSQLYERKSVKAKWRAVGNEFETVVGRSGLGWGQDSAPEFASEFKKEGDGKSPAGMFPLTFAFGIWDVNATAKFPYRKLNEFTECVDDINSNHYNKIVNRMQVGAFDWKSSEKMLAVGPEYALGVFVAYNSYPVVKGNGSCIFLHVWRAANYPTAGCTAMDRTELEKIVNWLDPKKKPYLIQLPEGEYQKYQKSWNLPKLK